MNTFQHQFNYTSLTFQELDEPTKQLVKFAEEALAKSYAPYSNFHVGCAVQLQDGTFLTGANHENAAYPAGICAERAALASLDMSQQNFVVAIAITFKQDASLTLNPITPCGICRQSIKEVQDWQEKPIIIYMCNPLGNIIRVDDANHLLPFSFGKNDLKTPAPILK